MLRRAVIFALAGLACAAAVPAATAAVDAAKLRAAAPLPSISFGYQATEGLIISSNAVDQSAQLNTLKKSLTGGTDDAERWRQIGLFYYQIKDMADSQAAYTRAVALYRTQMQARPGDEPLLVRYGAALGQLNLPDQAETVLRRAVRLVPNDAKAWSALGLTLSSEVFPALLTPAQRKLGITFEQPALLGTQFKDYKPSMDQIKQARQISEEAGRCFDQAVSVQPQAAVGYMERAGFRAYSQPSASLVLDALAQENLTLAAAVEKVSPVVLHNVFTQPGALADTRQAANSAPGDLPTIAGAVMFEMMAVMSRASGASEPGGAWKAAAPEKREAVMQDIQRLEQIAQRKDAATAANAAALIWMFTDQKQKAERDLHLAVALDPNNQSAWDGLTSLLVSSERYKDAAVLAAQRLKTLDNVHTRLTLAKIDDKLNLPAEVQAEVQAALKDDPSDLSANLAQAVLLLRNSGDPAVMGQARQRIDQCGLIYQKNRTPDNWSNYTIIVGVYDALIGSDADARKGIAQVLEYDPDNKEAAQVSAALGPSDTQKQIL